MRRQVSGGWRTSGLSGKIFFLGYCKRERLPKRKKKVFFLGRENDFDVDSGKSYA